MTKTKLFFIILIILGTFSFVSAETGDLCGIYFTGVGCPHCAKADPVVLQETTQENPELVIIEYEIYQQQENAKLIYKYDQNYETGMGIPLIIFDEDVATAGDNPIITSLEKMISNLESNKCLLNNGSKIAFEELDLNSLPNKPKIWKSNKILIKNGGGESNDVLKDLLETDNVSNYLKNIEYIHIKPEKVPLSGKEVEFNNAIELEGWIFQWNGRKINVGELKNASGSIGHGEDSDLKEELTLTKILSLAAVDAVNPCALAVLTLMLIAILTYNPKKKKNVLLAGLAFSCSVFAMYIIYGLVIIKSFQLIQALTSIRIVLYKILGVVAIILGLLNVKDFIRYKPGGLMTEMPLKLRPKMKKIVNGITSPKGAFVVGLFVTVFLLPCTVGPYVIAGGILSTLELIKTLPFLMIYNLVFILPMIGITIAVYSGFAKVQDVSGWKDRNIKYLHLVSGLIMFWLGIAIFMGWI